MTDLEQAIEQHGGIKPAARALGIAESTLRGRLKGKPARPRHDRQALAATPQGAQPRALGEFLARHDKATIVPARIREGLAKLGGGWMYEAEFLQLAHITPVDMGMYRDQFAAHWMQTPGDRAKRAWFGRAEDCASMRERV